MNWGWSYDLMVELLDAIVLRGKLEEVRRKTIDLSQLQAGERALDVGCGTGTLAMKAYARVGTKGNVCGIDPAPRQIARARSKAARRGFPIDFQIGVIERLPFPDQSFDVVLSTLMMHHLPDDAKRLGLSEIARVLKSGGRLMIVDFARPEGQHGQPGQFGAGSVGIQDLPALIKDAGFSQIESGTFQLPRVLGFSGAGFVRARTS
jgi:ubiquinone/menaquinone biosynthesis C-methylase UbiE